MGHYEKCCRSKINAATALPPSTPATRTVKACLSTSDVTLTDARSPRPVCIQLSMDMSSQIHMLPDTGADVIVKHLATLNVPRSSLQIVHAIATLTADGSEMSPALGCFIATLRLGRKSCKAKIQVHKDIPMSLLSYTHCKALVIIPQAFPKPIQHVHVNRCTELPISATTFPAAAKEYFLKEFSDVLVSKADLKNAPSEL